MIVSPPAPPKTTPMRNILPALLIPLILSGCGEVGKAPRATIPQRAGKMNRLCPQAPTATPQGGFDGLDLPAFLHDNAVEQIHASPIEFLNQFANELIKMPRGMRTSLARQGVKIHAIFGNSVKDDPSFEGDKTRDGRSWSNVPGSGGDPTRVVVNSLYKKHGSVNLVLHEHGHTLDSSGREIPLHAYTDWKAIAADPKTQSVMDMVCGSYCTTNDEESFAESLALYYACPASRAVLAESPLAIEYFMDLEEKFE